MHGIKIPLRRRFFYCIVRSNRAGESVSDRGGSLESWEVTARKIVLLLGLLALACAALIQQRRGVTQKLHLAIQAILICMLLFLFLVAIGERMC